MTEMSSGSTDIDKMIRIVDEIFERSNDIKFGFKKALTLNWGTSEQIWGLTDYALILLAAAGITPFGVGRSLLANFWSRVGSRMVTLMIAATAAAFANDIWGVAVKLTDSLFLVFDSGFLNYLRDILSWWDYAKISAMILGFIALAVASATWTVYLNLASLMIRLGVWAYWFDRDYYDSNNIYQG